MLGQKKLQKATRLPALERTWIPAPETKTPVQQSAFGNRLGSSLSEKEAFIANVDGCSNKMGGCLDKNCVFGVNVGRSM